MYVVNKKLIINQIMFKVLYFNHKEIPLDDLAIRLFFYV